MTQQGSILLIDDHPRFGQLFGLFVRQTAYGKMTFRAVQSLADGLAAIESDAPDIIFLDNFLVEHAGFEIPLKTIRTITRAPVILVSGSDLSELGYDDVPEELDGYVSKTDLSAAAIESAMRSVLDPD